MSFLSSTLGSQGEVHPLPSGHIRSSLGGHYSYRIIGPCCRLFDRETLPWPACRLQWHSKEPSWRRIGRRFVPDMSAKNAPSYNVEILEPGYNGDPFVVTLYSDRLSPEQRQWWYSRYYPPNVSTAPSSVSSRASAPSKGSETGP